MRQVALTMLLALAGTAVVAQEQAPEVAKSERDIVQQVVELKHQKAMVLYDLLQSGPVEMRPSDTLNAIRIRGPKHLVDSLVKQIQALDKPVLVSSRNIELLAYMIMASPQGNGGAPLPPELEPVAKQLRSIFGLRDFRLFETALVRTREGAPDVITSGSVDVPSAHQGLPPSIYNMSIKTATISSREERLIALNGFRFDIRTAIPVEAKAEIMWREIGFRTNLDLREGQKIVVGQSKVGQGDSALVLVLTARIID